MGTERTILSAASRNISTAGKALAATTTGQLWVAIRDGSITYPTIDMYYSNDDGVTWTEDTGGTIGTGGAGDSRNGCAIHIDAQDRIWYVVNRNGDVYVGVGTISGNAITWIDEVYCDALSSLENNITAFLDGSTPTAIFMYGQGAAVYCDRVTLSGSTLTDQGTLFGTGAGTFSSPAIDFYHTGDGKTVQGSTPHIFTAWGEDQTGTNSDDIQFRKLTYTGSGTWTDGTNRLIDNAADVEKGIDLFFDGTRVVIAGYDNTNNDLKIYERDVADTTTTPRTAGLSNVNTAVSFSRIGYDPVTGDVWITGYTSSNYFGYAKYDRAGDSWDASLTTIDTTPPFGLDEVTVAGIGAQIVVVWGDSAGIYFYDIASLNAVPSQPTWNNADNAAADVAETLTLDWNFVDVDSGDTQSKYKLERRTNNNLIPTPTDASLETDIGWWVAYEGCVISQSSGQAKSGTYSMLIDVTGGVDWLVGPIPTGETGASVSAEDVLTYGIPWRGGDSLQQMWSQYGVGHTESVRLYVSQYDASGTHLSSDYNSQSCYNGSWKYNSSYGSTNPNTRYLIPYFKGTAADYAAGEDVYLDDIQIGFGDAMALSAWEVPNPDWYDPHLSLPGEAGDYADAGNHARLGVTGDFEVEFSIAWAWDTSNYTVIDHWNSNSGIELAVISGHLQWTIGNGTANKAYQTGTTFATEGFTTGQRLWCKFHLDTSVSTGTWFYKEAAGDGWTAWGTPTQVPHSPAAPSGIDYRIGTNGTLHFPGKFYYLKMWDGDSTTGTLVLDADFYNQAPGAANFTDSPGNTITINDNGPTNPAEIVAFSDETWIVSATSQASLGAPWGSDGDNTHIYSVWTNDGTADSVSKSLPLRVIPSAQDNPTINTYGTITAKTYLITWTVTTQTKRHVRVYRDVGLTDLEYDAGIEVSAVKSTNVPFNEEGTRYIWVQTYNDEGLASDPDTEEVLIDWADPPKPRVYPNKTSFETSTTPNSALGNIYGGSGTFEEQGQSFKPTITGTISSILIRMYVVLSPTDDFQIDLCTDSDFSEPIATSNPFPGSDFTTQNNGLWRAFNFPTPPSVTAGTTYYIRCYRTGARDITNYYVIRGTSTSTYSDGQRWAKASGVWSSQTSDLTMAINQDSAGATAGAMTVVVDNPTPGVTEGGTASTSYNEIWRRVWNDDDTALRLDDDLAEDGTYTDWGPASGVLYQYKAVAFNSTNGTSNESDWTA